MTDLLIINPNSSKNYKNMDELKAIEPPVIAGMIAHAAQKAGMGVRVMDANALNLSPGEVVLKTVRLTKPKDIVIAVFGHNPTASTTLMPGAEKLKKELESINCPVKMIGVHPSAIAGVPDIADSGTGEVAWDLLPMDRYRAHNWHCFGLERTPYAALYTSMGCPYSCPYCPIHALFEKKYQKFEPDVIIKQIDILVNEYGVSNLKIADELFLARGHTSIICDRIIDRGYKLNMWAYGRVDFCPPKLLDKLKNAGLNWICLGIESGKGKGGDPRKAVQKFRDAGINVIGNYMFGLPGDDLFSMSATLNLAIELNTEFANFYSCMAYPGSKLYEQTDPKDLPDSWEGYGQYSYECKPLPTKHLTSSEILAFRDQAFRTYFTNPKYLKMMENKFGEEVRTEIEGMKMEIERKIL